MSLLVNPKWRISFPQLFAVKRGILGKLDWGSLVDFHEEASQATQSYEERQAGLEARFLDVLEDALTRIQRNPRLYQKVFGKRHHEYPSQ